LVFGVSVVFCAPLLIQKKNRLGRVLGSVIGVGRQGMQETVKYRHSEHTQTVLAPDVLNVMFRQINIVLWYEPVG